MRAAADALYLSRLAEKVILIHRRDTLRATKIYHEPLLKAENVEFMWNSQVVGMEGDMRLSGLLVEGKDGKTEKVACDGLFVSIGRQPATAFLGDALPLDGQGYIISDETTKTPVSGVFAAGDIRTKELRQVVTAVSDGAVAAHMAEKYLSL